MTILNLGCGTRTSDAHEIVNIDWSVTLRIKSNVLLRLLASIWMTPERYTRFKSIGSNILVHNLAKGIPFPDNSVDAVYHSHVLEHLDRDVALRFLSEVKRVLKPDGIHRIVVPDFETLCRRYLDHITHCDRDSGSTSDHDNYIADILEQCVRREASGSSRQSRLKRALENFMLGDARKRGETHQWMYDRVNLTRKLLDCGYHDVIVQTHTDSLIPKWSQYSLDTEPSGIPYKDASLYIEAIK